MTNKQIAEDVLRLVGNKENINSVVNCATRLRFKLKDESIAKTSEIKNHPGVVQVVQSGGQYQVVIGSHVSEVYKELAVLAGLTDNASAEDAPKEKQNVINTLIDVISSIFTPFLGVLAGTGVLKGLLSICIYFKLTSTSSGTYQILYAAADAFLYFLPIALAFTAAKKFKTNQFLAAALAMALVYPGIVSYTSGNSLTFLGIPVIYGAGYSSTVIPVILAVYLQSHVERILRKVIPRALSIFGVTLLTLLIMVPLTFIAIGPLGAIVGTVLGKGFSSVYEFSPVVAGLILGGLWQVAVIFGMHWGVVPLVISNLGMFGYDVLLPMAIPGVMAQSGAALGVFLKAKDVKLKSLASSGVLTAIFGITEPTVYGITLPLKKPFISACIGGAIGGAISGIFGVKTFAFSASIFVIPNYISRIEGVESHTVAGIAAIVIAFIIATVLTIVLGFDEKKLTGEQDDAEKPANAKVADASQANQGIGNEILASPLRGQIVKLQDVQDEVFSSGAMGNGIAIEPNVGELHAPADGTIAVVFPTGHAVGMTTDHGAELLMHIGMDTVEMDGKGFTAQVKDGDKVKKGDLLVKFDIAAIKAAGKPTVTPIIVTNSDVYQDVEILHEGTAAIGMALLKLTKQ